MNPGDFETAAWWGESGYVEFGRVVSRDMKDGRTHWCRLSDEAMSDAHAERRARAERLWGQRAYRITAEAREEE